MRFVHIASLAIVIARSNPPFGSLYIISDGAFTGDVKNPVIPTK
jgi:hypothetical protein